MLWDDDNVYFLGLIVDEELPDAAAYTENTAPDWETDNWEIYWAPSNTQLPDMTEMTQVRLSYANAGTDDGCSGVVNGWSQGGFTVSDFVTAAKADTDEGWIVEASFDLGALAAAVSDTTEFVAGSVLGFNTIACDNDGTEAREDIGGWILDAVWNEADTLGVLLLTEEMATPIVDQHKAKENIKVYPNPANNELFIASEENLQRIEIYNALGMLIESAYIRNNRIDISQLTQGMYIIHVYSDDEFLGNTKFLKE
jgi:hypothetical protein